MTALFRRLFPLVFAFAAALAPAVNAQDAAPAAANPPLPQEQLDALLAPIALYPDQLLAQVLMASTYPLDVVAAARYVKANPGLKGDALDKAIENENWDPSVQSLAAFPQVLDMMNEKLEWTQNLGDAYLDDQARVMTTVQSLREKARAAGNLKDSEQQKVIVEKQTIIIEPAKPEVVYVPAYNPTVVYGSWWAPAYPPFFWYPPPFYGYPPYTPYAGVGLAIGFGVGLAVGYNHWGWCNTNWGRGDININVNNNRNTFINNKPQYKNAVNNGNWQHRPEQRKGVAYRDQGTRDKYQKVDRNAVSARRDYRGYEGGGQRPGGGGAQTRDLQRPGGAGNGSINAGRPIDRSGGGAQTRDLQRPGGGNNGSISAGRPIDRTGGGGARPSPSFNTQQSRPQTQQFSNRGAQSRQAATPSRGGGGGGARAGGGGGGGGARGGGGRAR